MCNSNKIRPSSSFSHLKYHLSTVIHLKHKCDFEKTMKTIWVFKNREVVYIIYWRLAAKQRVAPLMETAQMFFCLSGSQIFSL